MVECGKWRNMEIDRERGGTKRERRKLEKIVKKEREVYNTA